jgi:hypothetical protein
MTKVDENSAEVLVFTFKEGLLSAMAHDLKLKVGHFSIELDGQALAATFDPKSLKVVTPRKDGKDAPGLLPTMLYAEIEKNAREDALNAKKFPVIRFAAALGQDEVAGQLTLCGQTREVRCKRSETATHQLAETWLDVRDFGMKPYSAMLGTLKVQARVQVVVSIKKSEGS